MKTGIVKDGRFADHDMGQFHVESPARIETLNKMIEEEISFPYLLIEPRPASEEEIEWVHARSYVQFLKATAGRERTCLDPDTSTSALTYATALLAVGGTIKALDLILEGRISNAFALVRPPGHHAESQKAMGFCFFNSAAVAAEHLIRSRGLKRILIVDFDLHHGNGTEHAFYSRNDVLYFSTHQVPLYPGTGGTQEIGAGKGKGYTINIPLLAGKGDADFLFIFNKILAPIAAQFKPEFILVSAGFDIAAGDPLGGMLISAEGFGYLTASLLEMADAWAQNRIAFVLEGGYDLRALREGVQEVLLRLAGEKQSPPPDTRAPDATLRELAPSLSIIREHWKI